MQRADILDRNGALLATSLPIASLAVNPKLVDPQKLVNSLIEIIPSLNREEQIQRLKQATVEGKEFIWIKRHLPPAQYQSLLQAGLKGLIFRHEMRRFYPLGNLFAHVVGFTNIDNQGTERLGMDL